MVIEPSRSFGQGALSEIGRLDDVCPTCLAALDKRPGRKTICPHCGAFIFVRTRPLDRKRVLVTAAQASVLEQEWARLQGPRISVMVDKAEVERLRPVLARKFGRDPSDNDVIWAYLNQELVDRGQNRQWGLYRNTRLSMAALLESENRSDAALPVYLEVCYLDANGPVNRGILIDRDGNRRVGQGPDFSQESNSYASGVLAEVVTLVLTLRLSDARLGELFQEVASRVQHDLATPVAPATVWTTLQPALLQVLNQHQPGN